jgi:hypothetical protein
LYYSTCSHAEAEAGAGAEAAEAGTEAGTEAEAKAPKQQHAQAKSHAYRDAQIQALSAEASFVSMPKSVVRKGRDPRSHQPPGEFNKRNLYIYMYVYAHSLVSHLNICT